MVKIKKISNEIYKHGVTGLSYMGPMFTIGAVLIVLGKVFEMTEMVDITFFFMSLGKLALSIVLPIFSMYVCYSIADKPGLIPGLFSGVICNCNGFGLEKSGFFGTFVMAIIVGYLVKLMVEKITLPDLYNSVTPTFIIPVGSVVLMVIIYKFMIGPVFGGFNLALINLTKEYNFLVQLIYGVVVSIGVSYDLGGKVNKTAVLIGTPLALTGVLPMTGINLAIVIPGIGLGISTMIDRVFKLDLYEDYMKELGKDALLLGSIAISEGGLPFLYQRPRDTKIINGIGSAIGFITTLLLGGEHWFPIPAFWGWFMADNIMAYISGIIVGAFVIALGNVYIRIKDKKVGEIDE